MQSLQRVQAMKALCRALDNRAIFREQLCLKGCQLCMQSNPSCRLGLQQVTAILSELSDALSQISAHEHMTAVCASITSSCCLPPHEVACLQASCCRKVWPFVKRRKHACLAVPCCCLCFSKDGMSTQTALDTTEGAKPSSSQSAQPGQTTNHASTSDGAADSSKPKQKQTKQQQQPVAQLLEDQGLNAELDAANTGLVETERDRLIRIVRTQLSSAHATYFAQCGIITTPALEIARNCKVPHTLLTTVHLLTMFFVCQGVACSMCNHVWRTN